MYHSFASLQAVASFKIDGGLISPIDLVNCYSEASNKFLEMTGPSGSYHTVNVVACRVGVFTNKTDAPNRYVASIKGAGVCNFIGCDFGAHSDATDGSGPFSPPRIEISNANLGGLLVNWLGGSTTNASYDDFFATAGTTPHVVVNGYLHRDQGSGLSTCQLMRGVKKGTTWAETNVTGDQLALPTRGGSGGVLLAGDTALFSVGAGSAAGARGSRERAHFTGMQHELQPVGGGRHVGRESGIRRP